ncbi:hypothetical protein SAICODRAFT_10579 [Saitoella complicata NRRL Y-17804]|uniref:uncharacterized protein n=1 Tax=Saitoella complicata (strain BCRC 22490 / CBS 7301 / JCM 7358 / NBRC 10748 / NRRL Y-17804) TaxID=698492 RepID=UPI000867E8FC|nr:uncharacterized protein SAICODRAFT_10579 [Saitoella complicata NRRL Y-17804]ODQ49695.1 hypothetical protein SAICODRAFT_10579 [Saitoella complicata NRRL Y-17804]
MIHPSLGLPTNASLLEYLIWITSIFPISYTLLSIIEHLQIHGNRTHFSSTREVGLGKTTRVPKAKRILRRVGGGSSALPFTWLPPLFAILSYPATSTTTGHFGPPDWTDTFAIVHTPRNSALECYLFRFLGILMAFAAFLWWRWTQSTFTPPPDSSPPVAERRRLSRLGPYGITRHPLYSALTLMIWSYPFLYNNWLFGVTGWMMVRIWVQKIRKEEEVRKRVGGDGDGEAWRRYVRRVMWKLVPGVW